jgi:hypothetical protein
MNDKYIIRDSYMKSLKHYIAESLHTYDCTIKVAGDVNKNFLDLFKYNLNKFEPVEIKGPTSTPVQKSPYGFPNLENEPVHIFKCKFAYPCTEPMVQQIAQLLGHNVNYVRLVNTAFDDSIDGELHQYENQMSHTPVLDHEDLEDNGKEASKAYGDKYLKDVHDYVKEREQEKVGLPEDQKDSESSFDPWKPWTDDSIKGSKSPMTDIKRPPKPKTGAGY